MKAVSSNISLPGCFLLAVLNGWRRACFNPRVRAQGLDELQNIRSEDQQALVRSNRWMKGLPHPINITGCGSRDELKQVGEGQKITVVAWALTAKKGSPASCNCDLFHQADVDNHIRLAKIVMTKCQPVG